MSTASLPSYHYEPQAAELRLLLRQRAGSGARRPDSEFIKNSKNGGVVLRLSGQDGSAALPEYGRGAIVEGTVELAKPESVQSVEVKVSRPSSRYLSKFAIGCLIRDRDAKSSH